MGCRECVSRREFFERAVAGAAALAALEACGDGQFGPTALSLGAGVTVKLADFPELQAVGIPVDVGNDRAVVRTGASTFIALSRICTHQGCDTAVRDDRFVCPCHNSMFSATGEVLRGPAERPLQRLALQYDAAAGTLTIA
jgi:cytochrome b6-f complex iron-sulfur subunit